jgi:LytS/YehU family sensor histidine kinase
VDYLQSLIANICILGTLAWFIFFLTEKSLLAESSIKGLIAKGVAFGITASALMLFPIELVEGIFGDARSAPMLLSGILFGPISASITALLAGLTRYLVGGAGTFSGMVYIVLIALIGIVVHRYNRKHQRALPTLTQLIVVSAVSSLVTMPVILLLPEEFQYRAATNIWPLLSIASVVSSGILGALLISAHKKLELENEVHQLEISQQQLQAEKDKTEREKLEQSQFIKRMNSINRELNQNLGLLERKLAEAEHDRVSLVARTSESALTHAVMVQRNAQLISQIQAYKDEIEVLKKQMSDLTLMMNGETGTGIFGFKDQASG